MDTHDLANLIALAADDELTAEDRARLDAHLERHPEDRVRIERAQSARLAIARAVVNTTPATPAALADRIRAAIQVEAIDSEPLESLDVAGRIDDSQNVTSRRVRPFDFRSLRPSALAAGIILLISAAIVFSTFNTWLGDNDSPVSVAQRWLDLEGVMIETFGEDVLRPNLSEYGYTFQNGELKVPRPDHPFCHVTYEKRRQGANDHSRFVIFEVEPAHSKLIDGIAYRVVPAEPSKGDPVRYIWRDGETQYRVEVYDDVDRAHDIALYIGMPEGEPSLLEAGNDQ